MVKLSNHHAVSPARAARRCDVNGETAHPLVMLMHIHALPIAYSADAGISHAVYQWVLDSNIVLCAIVLTVCTQEVLAGEMKMLHATCASNVL